MHEIQPKDQKLKLVLDVSNHEAMIEAYKCKIAELLAMLHFEEEQLVEAKKRLEVFEKEEA